MAQEQRERGTTTEEWGGGEKEDERETKKEGKRERERDRDRHTDRQQKES